MENIIIDSSDSDSDYEDSSDGHSEREEVVYESENFLNHVKLYDPRYAQEFQLHEIY